jgi:vacuolar-type H+-ATPase subunit H
VTDTQIDKRAHVVVNGPARDGRTSEHPLVAPRAGNADQALHVLAMAQRTAEEHVSDAHRHAEAIRADAMAAAEQIARDADAHAQGVRREADKALSEARASKEQAARDAEAHVGQAQRNAQKVLADARAEATSITAGARTDAEELKAQAQRRYEDIVGSLGARRAGLQEQIEALEDFDRKYRARLMAFMQGQMRALWADQPQVTGEPGEPEQKASNVAIPAQRQAPASPQHANPQQASPQHATAQKK